MRIQLWTSDICRMLFFAFVALWTSTILCIHGDDKFDAVDFLENFGYLQSTPGHNNAPDAVNKAIEDFQELFSLPATGHLDKRTIELMKQPRCGNADIVRKRSNQEPTPDPNAPMNYRTSNSCFMRPTNIGSCYDLRVNPDDSTSNRTWLCCPDGRTNPHFKSGRRGIPRTLEECECHKYRWPENHLTYKIENTPRNGDLQNMRELEREVQKAFKVWSDITPLTFRKLRSQSRENPDFKIAFKTKAHAECPTAPFDGLGSKNGRNILAHANPRGEEGSRYNGIVHFDDDETWLKDKNGNSGSSVFFIIAAHEIGHSLGLLHSWDPDTLMYAYYSYKTTASEDDIRGIQELYGPNPRGGPHPTGYWKEKKTKGSGRTEAPHAAHCSLTFDAVLQAHNDKFYAFTRSGVYEIKLNDGDPRKIQNPYRNCPSRVDAAVYSYNERKTYLFSGTHVYCFNGFNLDRDYPKRLSPDFRNLDSAFMDTKGRINVFKGDRYSRWRPDYDSSTEWRATMKLGTHSKFIKNMDALVRKRGSPLGYSFKGTKMVQWNSNGNGGEGSSDMQIDMRPVWLNCNKPIP